MTTRRLDVFMFGGVPYISAYETAALLCHSSPALGTRLWERLDEITAMHRIGAGPFRHSTVVIEDP